MSSEPFQLLSSDDKRPKPNGRCPVCGNDFRNGVAYLEGGGVLESEIEAKLRPEDHLGLLHVGFHGLDPEMRDSSDVKVVDHVHFGQFDLNWCSVACMREWLLKLLAEVERRAQWDFPRRQEALAKEWNEIADQDAARTKEAEKKRDDAEKQARQLKAQIEAASSDPNKLAEIRQKLIHEEQRFQDAGNEVRHLKNLERLNRERAAGATTDVNRHKAEMARIEEVMRKMEDDGTIVLREEGYTDE